MWINFITHARKRKWQWKPAFGKSHIVYSHGKNWIAPHWELSWGNLVLQWTGYSHRKEYYGAHFSEMNMDSDILQCRINELEYAIAEHRKCIAHKYSTNADQSLWNKLKVLPIDNFPY